MMCLKVFVMYVVFVCLLLLIDVGNICIKWVWIVGGVDVEFVLFEELGGMLWQYVGVCVYD